MSAATGSTATGGPVPRVRRDEVRRRLLAAAAEVFARRGYAAARLDEVAHAAGFTKGAVYSNFASKHALLAELIEQHVRLQLTVNTDEIRALGRPDRALEDIAAAYARGIVDGGTWSRLLVEIAQQSGHDPAVREVFVGVRRSLREELTAVLSGALASLDLELAVPAGQLALTLQSLHLGLTLEHGTDPEQIDEAAVAAVFTAVLRGALR